MAPPGATVVPGAAMPGLYFPALIWHSDGPDCVQLTEVRTAVVICYLGSLQHASCNLKPHLN